MRALGRAPARQGSEKGFSKFVSAPSSIKSQDFQNDYFFKLLGILVDALASGMWSKHLLELYYEGRGGRTLETLHLCNSKG